MKIVECAPDNGGAKSARSSGIADGKNQGRLDEVQDAKWLQFGGRARHARKCETHIMSQWEAAQLKAAKLKVS